MARFDFSLQAVLAQRETQERTCQMELAHARLALSTLEQGLTRLNDEIAGENETMRSEHLVGRLNVSVIAGHRRFLVAVRAKVIELVAQIAGARLEVEANQRKLAEAAKQRKAIETLRDKQKARWTAEQSRKELAIADDVGMQIAFHNLQQPDAAIVGGSAT